MRRSAGAIGAAMLLGLALNLIALWAPEPVARWLMTVAIVAFAVGISLISLDVRALSRRRR